MEKEGIIEKNKLGEKKTNLSLLLEIYLCFFKMGSMSFGGGYAIIPFFEDATVNKKQWIDKKKVIDIFAVAGSLPGAIGLNSAGMVGYNVAKIPGTIAAILGTLSPSVFIVLTLIILFDKFSTNAAVQAAFNGIRPAIIALIALAAYKIGKVSIKDNSCRIITVLSFSGITFIHLHPILVIALGALAGIGVTKIKIGSFNF